MFGLWTSNSQNPTASSIKEANEQLRAMHQRINDLEQRVREQIELLDRREQEQLAKFNQMVNQKDAVIREIKQELIKSDQNLAKFQGMIKERDVQIAFLLHRCSYLDEAASYAPLLDQLSNCLKGAFAAPLPKVQTVKPTRTMGEQQQPATSSQNTASLTESSTSRHATATERSQVIQSQIATGGKAPVVSYGVPVAK